jgi:amino acid transporter
MSFGLAREGLWPQWLGRLSKHRTPAYALTVAAVIPVSALVVYLSNASAATTIGLISGTAGLLYIVLYVAGSVACIWYYRRTLTSSVGQFVFAGLLPFVGGALLVYTAITAVPNIPNGTLYPFIVMIVAVFPAAWLVKRFTKAPFFDEPVLVADKPTPGQSGPIEAPAQTVGGEVVDTPGGHPDA